MNEKDSLILWDEILKKIQSLSAESTFKRLFQPITLIEMTDEKIILGVPNNFHRDRITEHYLPVLEQAVFDTVRKDLIVEFTIRESEKNSRQSRKRADEIPDQPKLIDVDDDNEGDYNGAELPTIIAPGDASSLNGKYTFDTFVMGKSNQFAHAAALAVAQNPGKDKYNPFFVYGGVGLGKTHLMHAIGHYIIDTHPQLRVLYVSSEKFTNELVNSIMSNKTELFRQKYRNIDVLLVDDVQFITGKQGTQEEFFHTFNTLRDADKQIVLSCDRPPQEVAKLEERLRSRFLWGLTTFIQQPDFETRIAILKKKSLLENVEVPDDVLTYIAGRIDSNIRELEGALTKVMAYASLSGRPINTELMTEALKDILPDTGKKEITVEAIKKAVAAHFNIKISDINSDSKKRVFSYPRQIAMYLSRELTDESLPQLGSSFERDHSTIMHAHDKIEADCKNNAQIRETITKLTEQLQLL